MMAQALGEVRRAFIGVRPYALAAAITLSAGLLKLLVLPLGEDAPFLLLTFAVVLSAWFGGAGPGLLSVALSTALAAYFIRSFPLEYRLLDLGVFLVEGGGVLFLRGRVSRAVGRAQTHLAEANQALQIRDEFISIAAHELKTPVTGMKGYIQMLQRLMARDGALDPPRARRVLGIVEDQIDRLGKLIEQLLDVSRIQRGRLALEPRLVDIADLSHRIAEEYRPSFEGRLVMETPEPLYAYVDPLRIERVITNLLSNAIRYGPQRGTITVRACERERRIRVQVCDDGPPIAPEKRDTIFGHYVQGAGSSRHVGFGLGLFVSREIVEAHGGGIWVEETEHGRNSFVVEFPAEIRGEVGSVGSGSGRRSNGSGHGAGGPGDGGSADALGLERAGSR
jgi:signal transduction histidine kinase